MLGRYSYRPPVPEKWTGFGSQAEIENDWVTDSRPKIHLTVKLAPRKVLAFMDTVFTLLMYKIFEVLI